ncbi:hypothetical protein ACFXG6_04320 [Streptomyces roseus]
MSVGSLKTLSAVIEPARKLEGLPADGSAPVPGPVRKTAAAAVGHAGAVS